MECSGGKFEIQNDYFVSQMNSNFDFLSKGILSDLGLIVYKNKFESEECNGEVLGAAV